MTNSSDLVELSVTVYLKSGKSLHSDAVVYATDSESMQTVKSFEDALLDKVGIFRIDVNGVYTVVPTFSVNYVQFNREFAVDPIDTRLTQGPGINDN